MEAPVGQQGWGVEALEFGIVLSQVEVEVGIEMLVQEVVKE